MTLKARAEEALSARRLRELLPSEVVEGFVGGTHTRDFRDNLLPGFTSEQVMVLHDQLARGDGGELTPTRTGKRRAHAPYSSAALAINAFERWLGSEADLRVDGLGGFSAPLEVEGQLQIAHGGGRANLDCLLRTPGLTVGVESKLTETLAAHTPVGWKDAYAADAMSAMLSGGWRDVFRSSLVGEWQPDRLGVEQLVKHALALLSRFPENELHLIYVWWEPLNGDEFAEVRAHRAQVQQLHAAVGGARPTLHALTYAELLAEWERLDQPAWISEHVRQLRDRYVLSL